MNCVEVVILWGSTVLHVFHVTPPRSFYVGEELGDGERCDFFIPSELLGTWTPARAKRSSEGRFHLASV